MTGGAWARVPDLLASHIVLAGSALLLGLLISLPLCVWAARRRSVARAALGFASLVQTIPSLALLALFYPILLALSGLVGGAIPALGFLPSLLALTLYALLPILRNGITGLNNLDPAVLEAADGVGMTGWQKLWMVEAPLVVPVLMAGIRTAAVWVIGTATLSTTVGQPSLGDLIFAGLQTQNWNLVIVGCISAAALAMLVDALLGVAEHGLATRKRGRVIAALTALGIGLVVALVPAIPTGGKTVVIGAKGFTEQYILARVMGDQLEKAGYRVVYREGLGSAVVFNALSGSDVDAYVDYSGTIWTNQMHRKDVPDRQAIVKGVGEWAAQKHDVRLLGALGFENVYAFAMRGEDARRRGISSISDLAKQARQLNFGTDLEFLERPEWRAVKQAYGIQFKSARAYNPSFMYRAIASKQVDVISAYSSDGRIAELKLRTLTDPKNAIPGYDAILMVSPRRAKDDKFINVLKPLIGRIPVEVMREANLMVDRDRNKKSPAAAAKWLEQRVGLSGN